MPDATQERSEETDPVTRSDDVDGPAKKNVPPSATESNGAKEELQGAESEGGIEGACFDMPLCNHLQELIRGTERNISPALEDPIKDCSISDAARNTEHHPAVSLESSSPSATAEDLTETSSAIDQAPSFLQPSAQEESGSRREASDHMTTPVNVDVTSKHDVNMQEVPTGSDTAAFPPCSFQATTVGPLSSIAEVKDVLRDLLTADGFANWCVGDADSVSSERLHLPAVGLAIPLAIPKLEPEVKDARIDDSRGYVRARASWTPETTC